jgi:NADH-quinone oxidoreductase subunit K
VLGIFLNRKNLIVLLMAIELMLLAVNFNFIAFSHYLSDTAGQIFVFFILTVAAAEIGHWLGHSGGAVPQYADHQR